jgi:hypothetical protein
MHRWFRVVFGFVLAALTIVLCELAFRGFDRFTNPNQDVDLWVKRTNREVQPHPLLGYTYPPGKMHADGQQTDEFGMPNAAAALASRHADIVGIGDSYVQAANTIFFEQFKAHDLQYHSLALFGYGPPAYNVLLKEYSPTFAPDVVLYFTYLGNDPGDARRFESWQASGKSWYEFNGGYFMPIERQGYVWGWRLFAGRLKRGARNVLSSMSGEAYGALKHVIRRDEAETVFDYVRQANDLARRQNVRFFVFVIPRLPAHKPFLDPTARKFVTLCADNGVACQDLDAAFGDERTRAGLFAPDGHWNAEGIRIAWNYLWNNELEVVMQSRKLAVVAK